MYQPKWVSSTAYPPFPLVKGVHLDVQVNTHPRSREPILGTTYLLGPSDLVIIVNSSSSALDNSFSHSLSEDFSDHERCCRFFLCKFQSPSPGLYGIKHSSLSVGSVHSNASLISLARHCWSTPQGRSQRLWHQTVSTQEEWKVWVSLCWDVAMLLGCPLVINDHQLWFHLVRVDLSSNTATAALHGAQS